jgi:hypothetical protein
MESGVPERAILSESVVRMPRRDGSANDLALRTSGADRKSQGKRAPGKSSARRAMTARRQVSNPSCESR